MSDSDFDESKRRRGKKRSRSEKLFDEAFKTHKSQKKNAIPEDAAPSNDSDDSVKFSPDMVESCVCGSTFKNTLDLLKHSKSCTYAFDYQKIVEQKESSNIAKELSNVKNFIINIIITPEASSKRLKEVLDEIILFENKHKSSTSSTEKQNLFFCPICKQSFSDDIVAIDHCSTCGV